MPEMYPVSENNKRVRKCVVHKNTTLFYEFKPSRIIILSLVENRVNPENIRF